MRLAGAVAAFKLMTLHDFKNKNKNKKWSWMGGVEAEQWSWKGVGYWLMSLSFFLLFICTAFLGPNVSSSFELKTAATMS